jgi:histidinol-phosphatase (PHP family)
MKLEDAMKKAGELNLGITVTEHIDLNYPDPTAFRLDVAGYFQEYAKYRSPTVLLGVEIGLSIEEVADNRAIIENFPFDYVIGSIHIVNGVDTYIEDYYRGKTKQQAYSEYLNAMIDCLQCYPFIDSLGHIDYICRYARFQDRELYYDEFKEAIDEVLMVVAQSGKCLELNTRRIDDPIAKTNLIPIYRRFREVGGRYITIGSDAHHLKDIGKNFTEALHIAELCELKPVWFNNRQMQYVKM